MWPLLYLNTICSFECTLDCFNIITETVQAQINSTRGSSWDARISPSNQEISRILWNETIHHRFHNSPTAVTVSPDKSSIQTSVLFTSLLTPCSTVLLEKLTGLQLLKKFPALYGTRRFITAFTSARHLSLTWPSSIQSIPPYPTPKDPP
jgi:hypothetical protein